MQRRMNGVLFAAVVVILSYSAVAAIIVLTPDLRAFYIDVGSAKVALILVWFAFFIVSAALIWPVSLAIEANQLRAVVRGHLPLPERDLSKTYEAPWKDLSVSEGEEIT